jgi:hypothetical protein
MIGDALIGMGLSVHRVQFAAGQDANAAVCTAADPAEMVSSVLRVAPWVGGPPRIVVPALPGQEAAAAGADRTRATEEGMAAAVGGAVPRPAAADSSSAALLSAAPVALAASATAPAAGSTTAALPAGFRETGPDELMAAFPPRQWRVRGWRANTSYDRLKVALRVIDTGPGGQVWGDQIDLANGKQRQGAVAAVAAELGTAAESIKAELASVWLATEALQDQSIRAQQQAAKPAPVDPVATMTPERMAAAAAFLRRPDILSVVVAHADACGVVGEAANVEVCYLAGISRKLPDPLAVLIQASSSAGKSSLQDGVMRFIPPEDKLELTDLTGAALRYLGEDALCHKAVAVAEDEGAANAVYSIKVMQSAGSLRIAAPVKNPATNELETKVREVRGPVAFFQTSTKPQIDEELQNRCLVLTVDESREQTQAVHARQRDLETVAGFRARQQAAAILQLHHDAQRLLQPLRVFNPYAPHLTFTSTSPRTRRDHAKYLRLIRVIAFLRQQQRPLQRLGDGTAYIEATLEDVADANRLAAAVLGRGLDELAPQTRRLLHALKTLVDGLARAQATAPDAVRFTRRQVREHTAISPTQLHVHLTRLIDLEYVHAHRVGSGGGMAYELAWTGEGQDGQRFCLGLIDVAELGRRRLTAAGAHTLAATPTVHGIPGREATHSGAIRSGIGPDSGVFRGAVHSGIIEETRPWRADGATSADHALPDTVPASDHTVGVA